ncbi:hypothetical protein HWV62_16100 [Athelia sp. TMB]|nr:hypothetical protein HWV62_16100 [Athelia sp. TMB]
MSSYRSHITMTSFVWSTTTLVLNRSMLHVRRVEVVSAFVCGRMEPERAASPSSVAETQLHEWALEDGVYDKMAELMPTHSRGTSAGAIELRKVSHWGAIFDEDDEHAQSHGPFNGDGGVFQASQAYTKSEVRGVSELQLKPLKLVIAASVISLTAVVGLLSAIGLSAWNTRRSADKNLFVRTHVAALFVSLLCCDLLQTLGSIMSAKWTQAMLVYVGNFCTTQGAIKQIADVGTAIFAFVIAAHTFWLLFLRWQISNRALGLILLLAWCSLGAIVVSGPARFDKTTRGPFYGISGYWCWITDPYDPERLTLDYIFMFLSAFSSFILYTLVFLRLRGNIVISGRYVGFRFSRKSSAWRKSNSSDTQMMTVARQMLLDTVYQLSGLINVILFTTTRRILPPNSISIPNICRRISLISNNSKVSDVEIEEYYSRRKSLFTVKPPTVDTQTQSYTLDITSDQDIHLEHRVPKIKPKRSLEFSPIEPGSPSQTTPPSPLYTSPMSPPYSSLPSPSYTPSIVSSYITPPSPAYMPPYSRDNTYAFGGGLYPATNAEYLAPIAERDDSPRGSNEYRRSELPEFFIPFDYSTYSGSGENSGEEDSREQR